MVSESQLIAQRVRDALESRQPSEYRLNVLENGIRRDGDWWEVVVQPDRSDIRSYDYHTTLAETENELEEAGLNVLLVPVLPG